MIRFVFRLFGYLLLAVALVALVLDGVAFLANEELVFKSAGATWTDLAPATLNQTQFAIQEHLGLIWLWDQVFVWILLQPTFAVLGVLGLIMLFLGRRRKKKREEFAA